ncbi:uncharacterized protein MKZ38_009863 [Zalerion maritima]|uniref:Exocyst complex component SEC5 n=1 Tax=Zalerion maritima TaxID=339359 RepID=A0AAD5S182_9PEZI|nr:uncharacterized protein MKZ38_009863 [Zalerion maritima]
MSRSRGRGTGEFERQVLEYYQLPNPFPTEWPADKNQSDDSEEEQESMKAKIAKRKSRYQALEKAINKRQSYLPGSETSAGGATNLVQKDEPDPLGSSDSVVRVLRSMGVPIHEDQRLRNRFLLSSTSFSPALFLSQVHATDDSRALHQGLDVLQASIDQKSASLKVLVESNFERFVRAKATIDNVYREMKYRGAEPPTTRPRGHSRHTSRTSYRQSMAASTPTPPPGADARKKNALIKESEYGVMGIKTPLVEVVAKAEDVWGPALGGRETEETLKTVGIVLDGHKEYIETSAMIADSIKRKDHETVVEEYTKARKFADDTKKMASQIGPLPFTEPQLFQIILAARMWYDVDEQITAFKRDIWKRLIALHTVSKPEAGTGQPEEGYMELISLLLELGVEDNPIWVYLLSRYDYLKSKIQAISERSKIEIEILRRRLANKDKPTPQSTAVYFQRLGRQIGESKTTPPTDDSEVVELWDKMLSFLANLLSPRGVLGEVMDFWRIVAEFIRGKAQSNFPVGYNNESAEHHRISQQGSIDLQKGVIELVDHLRENALMFFVGPPPEDISQLFSPLPQSPNTPMSAISGSLTPTALRDPRFNFDANSIPPPSPKRGESWEKFAFWVPWSNSVSAVFYLSKMLALVGSGAAEMASINPVARGDAGEIEKLKNLVAAARERCVSAICGAWNRDAENIKFVEDWTRSTEKRDQTMMPAVFATFEGSMLTGMQRILYISDAMSRPGAEDIVLPPPNKQLQSVRAQYVNTIYKALSGMVENAERSVKKTEDDWTVDIPAGNEAKRQSANIALSNTVDAGDRNVRMLLTLSNLSALRNDVVPKLNGQFENAFSVKLTDESKTIRDVLGQIDARLFQSYTRQYQETLKRIIRLGITSSDWAPPPNHKPIQVRPYVYEALLSMVLVHSQVSTTAASLTIQVLSYLLEQTSKELLESFKQRPRYDLAALMQATLDVEFVAQTMSQYTTDKASEAQSAVYQELDGRTDNEARARLQAELPEMRAILKRLREQSRNEFSCFRKPKRQATERRDTGGSSREG